MARCHLSCPAIALLLLVASGCLFPVKEKVNSTVCDLANHPIDLQPPHHLAGPSAASTPEKKDTREKKDTPEKKDDNDLPAPKKADGFLPISYQKDTPKTGKEEPTPEKKDLPRKGESSTLPTPLRELTIPPEMLPGGTVQWPIPSQGKTLAEIARSHAKLYPPLPDPGEDPEPPPGPQGVPLTLADLQKLAGSNSPLLQQAVANVEAARGAALQAGMPPNPNMGYEMDTIGTTGGAGYQGGFIEQTIKTANKLQLARAAAAFDLANAELALRKARSDLTSKIRGDYFAILVARESVKVNRAVLKFASDVYRIHVGQLQGGLPAPYEPMYLRSLAIQAQAGLVQARNRYTSAWKQLASDMGLPGFPPTQLAGRLDIDIPVFRHEQVLAHMLAHHTDLRTAENTYAQAQINLKIAQVTPIPDVTLRYMLQKDYTGPPFELASSLAVTLPVPIWDRNQGGILQAQGLVLRAQEEAHRVRSDLARTLSDAFERYENNRVLLSYYRDQILPDQVRYFLGTRRRYNIEMPGIGEKAFGSPAPGFLDMAVAQQNLVGTIGTYLTTLGAMWQAVVDVADLLQTDDLFGVKGPVLAVAPIPDLEKLHQLPCEHPCSPLPHAHQKIPYPQWPPADPRLPLGNRPLPDGTEAILEKKKPRDKKEKLPPLEQLPPTPEPGGAPRKGG
jgi:cobalt-zinc-cadmium efflux system outer membrane protein